MQHQLHPDVQLLASISLSLRDDYVEQDAEWLDSPFGWIKSRPSRQVGKVGEQLVGGWFASRGVAVGASHGSDSDRLIHNHNAEIKFSTLWKGGFYKFQQLRDQDYDIVICLGVSPFDAHCWVIPKSELQADQPGLSGQHGGQAARDTRWLEVRPSAIPSWMAPFDGSLASALASLRALGPGSR